VVTVRDTQDQATAQQKLWEASAAKHQTKLHEEHRLAWLDFHRRLYIAHSRIAADHAYKALALEDASVTGIGDGWNGHRYG
jgi:hypothetical protein